jgi:hypothetical protein
MKIRSLLLGSVAAAGLSTGAFAADLGVLTSLDVCDALGLSGLTISSDTNCLQITGSVSYEFVWGDYEGATITAAPYVPGVPVTQTLPVNSAVATTNNGYGTFSIATPGASSQDATVNNDWSSKVEAWIKFVATADSDFGPAKAVIKIKDVQYRKTINERVGIDGSDTETAFLDTYTHGDDTGGPIFDEAYVAVGDTTVIMAGKKGTLMNFGDDVPLNFLGLFNSEKTDVGVKWTKDLIGDGGHVIQIASDLGNGVSVAAGLENLNGTGATATSAGTGTLGLNSNAGTAFGVIAYAGDGIAAHLTVAASGVLDGVVENWGFHAGVSGSFDIIKFVAAAAGANNGSFNALGSVAATFDMFTIAASGEVVRSAAGDVDYGAGGSISAGVTDGVTINVGGRWYRDATLATDSYQVAAQLVAAVTESITLTGEVGVYGSNMPVAPMTANVFYGAAQVAWAPGGGFTSSAKGEVYSNGAYKATFKAAKTFE